MIPSAKSAHGCQESDEERSSWQRIRWTRIEIFGRGVLKLEGGVVDKETNVYGGGRNAVMYKVTPDGKVSELCTLPAGSTPNGVTMDHRGNLVCCDLGKKAMMRVTQSGQVSMIADRAGKLALTLPNFASYDADGNLYVSNSSNPTAVLSGRKWRTPSRTEPWSVFAPTVKGEILATGIYLANGTAIDPKEEAVYVLESTRNDCLRIEIKRTGPSGKPEHQGGYQRELDYANRRYGRTEAQFPDPTAPSAGRYCKTSTSRTWKANTSAGFTPPSAGIRYITSGDLRPIAIRG